MTNNTQYARKQDAVINRAGMTLMGLVILIGVLLVAGKPDTPKTVQANTPVCEDLVPPPGMTAIGAATVFASNHPDIPRTEIDDMFVKFAESKGLDPNRPLPELEHGALTVCLKPGKTAMDWIYVK